MCRMRTPNGRARRYQKWTDRHELVQAVHDPPRRSADRRLPGLAEKAERRVGVDVLTRKD
jgi:hypothetical protein